MILNVGKAISGEGVPKDIPTTRREVNPAPDRLAQCVQIVASHTAFENVPNLVIAQKVCEMCVDKA